MPNQQEELQNYQLVRDRSRKQLRLPNGYGFLDLISYALTMAREIRDEEPNSYKEAIRDKNSAK